MIEGMNRYGVYKFKQKNEDTHGLRVFKSEEMSPKEKFDYFINVINPEKTSVAGWLKFTYNGGVYYIKKKELYTILLTLSNMGTPYYYGDFGTGKSVVATALMKKLFGRVVVFRMLRNMTPIELFGQYDPIAVHTSIKLVEKHIMKNITEEYYRKMKRNDTHYYVTQEKLFDSYIRVPFEYIIEKLPEVIGKVKQVNFQFSNIGKALEENAGLIIDEVDKVSDYELTPLSSITQDKNRYLPIPDFGSLEFNQPVILLGNSKSITKFIGSRVVKVKREHLPVKLFKELLHIENVVDPVIIEKMVELYKYVETGELTIRDLINTAKNMQTFYKMSGEFIDPDIEQALIPISE